MVGISVKFDGTEDNLINPRVTKIEEIKKELEVNLFSSHEDDNEALPLLREFEDELSGETTYEVVEGVENREISESSSEEEEEEDKEHEVDIPQKRDVFVEDEGIQINKMLRFNDNIEFQSCTFSLISYLIL